MPLTHGERQHEGRRAERLAADMLSRMGNKVVVSPSARAPYDLLVNGVKVEVKAAIYTEHALKGGGAVRGFVFSNLHGAEQARWYMLLCMSPDRSRVLDWYMIPSSVAPARTLTITPGGKYEGYRKKVPTQMQKKAAIAAWNIPYPPMVSSVTRRYVSTPPTGGDVAGSPKQYVTGSPSLVRAGLASALSGGNHFKRLRFEADLERIERIVAAKRGL